MNSFEWKSFLKQESQKALAKYKEMKSSNAEGEWEFISYPPEVLESEWLGFSGASEAQIVATETRLGVSLPTSYREFLK